MKQTLYLLIFLFLLSCDAVHQNKPPLLIDLSSSIVTPKQYIITKSQEEIIIDGRANEPSWKLALFSDSFIDIEGEKTPKYDTKIKMLWDENYLYVFAQMEEPHIWGDLKKRDTIIYFNNDFEVFISPSGTTRNYCEIEINALGTVWDLLLNKPYHNYGKANSHWNLNDLKSAVHIEGTLNDLSDIDSCWNVEMAIPMKALIELKNRPRLLPKEGEQWRINFSRVEWDYEIINGSYQRKKGNNNKFLPEYNWVWSNQKVINMHQPEKWGSIQFTHTRSSENILFKTDEHLPIKQIAYTLSRKTNRGSLKYLLDEKAGDIRILNVKFTKKDSIKALFYKTHFGFEYKIEVPQSDQVFIINEAGVLKTIK